MVNPIVEHGHCYVDIDHGMFMVRKLSKNNHLVTILDTYGQVHNTTHAMLQNCTEIERETFDNMYKQHHADQNVYKRKNRYYYSRYNY
jgi:hypothetical protein